MSNVKTRPFMNHPEDPTAPSSGEIRTAESPAHLPAFIPPLDLKKILVPTDFSENSNKALRYAARLAQLNNSRLILFHAFELPELVRSLPHDFSYESNEVLKKLFDSARERSEEKLVALSRSIQGTEIMIETSQRLGTPYEEIVNVARECEIDLIVIATHGYTGMKHFLLGSTAERVINVSPCPVLIVRQAERDFVS
jgi:universal stress protein A